MKFFKILSVVFLACIALFFIVGLFLPKVGEFEKSYEINATAADVEYELFELYKDHAWPVWNLEDTSVVYTDFDDGYSWKGNNTGEGEVRFAIGADMSVRDHITIRGKEMAETSWLMEGGYPIELTVNFKVFAGGNIGARWTNLFIKGLIGDDVDAIVASIKEKVEL